MKPFLLLSLNNRESNNKSINNPFIIMASTKQSVFLLLLVSYVCSTTLFSVSPNYAVTYQKHYEELAHGYYDQKLNEHGMNYIYIYANGEKSLLDQHRGAGFIEGYMTYRDIYAAYNNLNKFKINAASVSARLQDYLDQQVDFIEAMAKQFDRDLYWQHVYAYLEQCRYAYRGYLQRLHEENRLDMYIGFSQFYYLTSVGDFRQLLPAYQPKEKMDPRDKSCSIYVKNVDGKLYVGHSTMNYYPYMLRIYKTYNFPTRNANVGSDTITFSSRPGDFNSKDDFYILSSGLKVMETSLLNFNPDNSKDLNPKTVPCWIRATVASHLARNGEEWLTYFSKFNSGTHNNQWVIVDETKLASQKNAVVFLEQAFSLIRITDVTSMLLKNGYVASYNVPYNREIYVKLGTEHYEWDYDTEPRAAVFKNYHPKMVDEESMKYWMLMNEQEDVRNGIAPREDQYIPSPAPYGIIDCKILTPNTHKDNYYWVISSPSLSDGRFPPFNWNQFKDMSHEGMPDIFNFTWQKVAIDWEKGIPKGNIRSETQ